MGHMVKTETLNLTHGMTFHELYERDGLVRLDGIFLDFLNQQNASLAEGVRQARAKAAKGEAPDRKEEADLMLAVAPHLDAFIGGLFGNTRAIADLRLKYNKLANISECKKVFVQRTAAKAHRPDEVAGFDGAALAREVENLLGKELNEQIFADAVMGWLEDKDANAAALDLASRYAAWASQTKEGRHKHRKGQLFKLMHHVDHFNLVETETTQVAGVEAKCLPSERFRERDGFHLTDKGADKAGALDEINYCVLCHNRGRDSCSHGIRDKQTGAYGSNPLRVPTEGCPLEERISEMHEAKMHGYGISALAIVCVDNPMTAGTGHRICNDCMKACIFQKQDPVNIPEAETRILKDVLELPWGFEIYSLLTRWNPLNFDRPYPKAPTGYKVLVVGLGPAGFTLSHHLMNEGHAVAAIDGLKIEPLKPSLCGVAPDGHHVPFEPVHRIADLREMLDERSMAGFGGVAEYGITVRWDKNFLKVIRLVLERRREFDMFGGVRFGGTITPDDAAEMGFDHIALCAGAGAPTVLDIPNGLARGVRQASDFLMALQLTGAAKKDSIANLQLRLPVVVVGGGLTAIDAATEALTYYARQVEKFLERYEVLVAENGEAAVKARWTPEDAKVAEEFIAHGKAIRAEREAAEEDDREPKFIPLLQSWGGATIAYRRKMIDSPAYRLNHEEIEKAMEHGIWFAELLSPLAVEVDEFNHAAGLKLERMAANEEGKLKGAGEEVTLPAKAVLVAAGTRPNTVLAQENPTTFELDGKYFQAINEAGEKVTPEWTAKPENNAVLMAQTASGTPMSFFGDLHPSFAGNVVKAMASARKGYPIIDRVLAQKPPSSVSFEEIFQKMDEGLRVVVQRVERLTPTIIEVVMKAPLAAKAFKPGQFFRLQNFETLARRVDETTLAAEGMALTGAWVDKEKGLVSVIVLEMGGSSNLCAHLKPGEPVILMGPTGAPTETPSGETVLLAGGGLGNAVLFSIGQALRQAGSKVLYFAAYKDVIDRYHVENIEKAADIIVWCCDTAPGFKPGRPQDKAFVGNVVQAMEAYTKGELGETEIGLGEVDRLIAIGSDRMMDAVARSRHENDVLEEAFKAGHVALGSINSPMQCMMKKICAQCLQKQVDPETGEESVVFTCFNQDQELDKVDFNCLNERLRQNALQEKLTAQWIAHCLAAE